MLKYTKILCAFDFDGNSTAALLLASALAKENNATLHILHIARVPTQDMDVPLPFDAEPRWEKDARAKLAQIAKDTTTAGVQYVIDVRTGVPDIDIVRVARELAVDLIVIATHGRTGFKHFALGSVAERVVREAPCPVLVTRATFPASVPVSRSP
jgi:nucleotide-binding universal stress UspA family protein